MTTNGFTCEQDVEIIEQRLVYQDCRKTSPLQGEDVRQWHESPPLKGLA
jgi:hypothetical protein